MAYLSSLGLENFRTFRERADFDFAPLTILTGPNSSGKSSIFKALLLLQENVRRGDLSQLDFVGGEHNLGSFKAAKSRESDEADMSINIEAYWGSGYGVWYLYQGIEGNAGFTIGQVGYVLTYKRIRGCNQLTGFAIYTRKDEKKMLFEARMTPNESNFSYHTTIHGDWFFRMGRKDAPFGYEWGMAFEEDRKEESLNLLHSHLSASFDDDQLLSLSEIIERACTKTQKTGLFGQFYPSQDVSVIFDEVIEPVLQHWTGHLDDIIASEAVEHTVVPHAQPQRIYEVSDGQREFVSCLSAMAAEDDYSDGVAHVNRWLRAFEVGEYLDVEQVAEGAFTVKIVKDGSAYALADMGYGVAQLLPLILQTAFEERPTLLVEEPETNLHPNLQSKLGDLFADLTAGKKQRAIVETHSEYLIRRLQHLVAKGELEPDRVAIYYLSPDPEADDYVRRIEITESGQLSQPFGSGFFDEATNLMVDLYKYGSQN